MIEWVCIRVFDKYLDHITPPSRLADLKNRHNFNDKAWLHTNLNRTNYGRRTVVHRAMTTWNSIPHQVTCASSKIKFQKQIKNTPYGTAGTVKRHAYKRWHTHCIHTYTRILCCRYVVVELWPEGICCECILMFLKLYDCLKFCWTQRRVTAVLAAANGDPIINTIQQMK